MTDDDLLAGLAAWNAEPCLCVRCKVAAVVQAVLERERHCGEGGATS